MRLLLMTAMSISIIAVVLGCAAVGTPDGGPFDETPPRFVGSTPSRGARNFNNKKLTLHFDEYIKIQNASEKVVVSPPQLEQPEIKVNGMKIQVTLFDSLRTNTTYSIDFADGIVDNNEGNSLGDFCFNFSTGADLDTMEFSGYVLNASDLEPIKGILVGIHRDLSDSAFTTKPFEKVSHTDSRGHFTIRGLAPGKYRIYALQDMDQNFMYSQRSEKIAWTDSIIIPSSELWYRDDTIRNTKGLIDSIKLVPYTKYLPDDIVLRAFLAKPNIQYLVKSERTNHETFGLNFALPLDSMPKIKGLNFDEKDAYICQHNAGFDTLQFWMKDSNIYYMDTLRFSLTYLATDSNGVLNETIDTLNLITKKTHQRILQEEARKAAEDAKDKEKERKRLERDKDTLGLKKLDIPKTKFLQMNLYANQSMDLNSIVKLSFKEPVSLDPASAIHVQKKKDTLWVDVPFEVEQDSLNILEYSIFAEWRPEETYSITIDSASVFGLYGLHNNKESKELKFKPIEQYSIFTVNVQNPDPNYLVELLNQKGTPIRSGYIEEGRIDFFFLYPGKYYVRLINDRNKNGKWDTGEFSDKTFPEEVFYINKEFELKQNWEHKTEPWNVTEAPLFEQKPQDITTQKAETKKQQKSKNAEREQKISSQKKKS